MNEHETTGALADGGRYRATSYLVELIDAAGVKTQEIDRAELRAVERKGSEVRLRRRKGGDIVVRAATLDDAGRLEAALRPAVGAAPAAAVAPAKKRGFGRTLLLGCGGLIGLFVVVAIIAVAAGGGGGEQQDASGDSKTATSGNSKAPAANTVNLQEPLRLERDGWVVTGIGVSKRPTVKALFETKTALGVYLIVEIKLENVSKEAQSLGADRFTVVDDQGRRFPHYRDGTIGNGQKELGSKINPGLSGLGAIVFDVPVDAKGLHLETLRGARINLGDVPAQ